MNHFFNNSTKKKLTTLASNIENGKTTERYFAGLLTTALNARVSFTSRTEDDSKVDLVTIFSHPWIKNEVRILATQVKSGNTYASYENGTLIIKPQNFTDLLSKNDWTLVCWTKVENDEGYWFLVKPNSKFIKPEYNSNHILNPLTKFHLIRIIYSKINSNGGLGLIFKRNNIYQKYNREEFISLRLKAKNKYSKIKKLNIVNPLFGEIEFTRLGWRHITRESRWYYYTTASFEAIQILDKILLLSPTKHYTLKHETNSDNSLFYTENEYLLNYDKIKVFDSDTGETKKVEVFIKLLEISGYQKDWKNTPKANINYSRRVIFKSIYYK
ncbi:hypothetical protein [Zunongwangia profunda]|uniref:hypothetical protein n=1 Tax=Zunongwangia profunda TaxID=398743 RepID=UPI001D18F6CF|nr:hypothetical protein [Zunongwangia profunda]MCC4227871.1 hypothetical protein [Zunongwangia profunda]